MTSLEKYLQTQTKSFSEEPFNCVDSLILNTLCYLNFEEYPYIKQLKEPCAPLIDILRFTPFEKAVSSSFLKKGQDVEPFLHGVATNYRYHDLTVHHYVNEYSEYIDRQFSAVTFTAEGMPAYIAFRGTDGTVVGWKEDFKLSYKEILPSHQSALRYLSGIASYLPPDEKINLGGHSKGGNLAEYAAAVIHKDVYNRIEGIYNNDGPGFLEDPSPRYNEPDYIAKQHKYLPESSLFGMIMQNSDRYKVVKSDATSLLQHRPLTWVIEGNDFAYKEDLNDSAKLFDKTFDTWMKSATPKQREVFLDTIFDLIATTEAKSWASFQKNFVSNMTTVLANAQEIDPETKTMMKEVIARLGRILAQNSTQYVTERAIKFFENNPK